MNYIEVAELEEKIAQPWIDKDETEMEYVTTVSYVVDDYSFYIDLKDGKYRWYASSSDGYKAERTNRTLWEAAHAIAMFIDKDKSQRRQHERR